MKKHAVLFTLIKGNMLLLEERTFPGLGETHFVFLGGHVETGETVEAALIREITEELGIRVKSFQEIPVAISYPHKPELILHPFVIEDWEGDLPEQVLDQANSIKWVLLEEAITSPLERVKVMSESIKQMYGSR